MSKGPTADDYMTGKATPMDKEGVGANQLSQGGYTMGEQVTVSMVGVLDHEAKIRDDPLLAIKKREQAKYDEVRDNPLQMHQIRQTAKQMKKEAKLDKKLKKAMKHGMKDKKEKKDKKERDERRDEGIEEVNTHLSWEMAHYKKKMEERKAQGLPTGSRDHRDRRRDDGRDDRRDDRRGDRRDRSRSPRRDERRDERRDSRRDETLTRLSRSPHASDRPSHAESGALPTKSPPTLPK